MSRDKIGVLTGGGDCPGLNPAIRAVVRMADRHQIDVVGFKKGWAGPIQGHTMPLSLDHIDEILLEGGTILGSSRTNPYKGDPSHIQSIKDNIKKFNLRALVAIGGEDTMGVAHKLSQEGLLIVGIPKTIDNDLDATDMTLGFPSAVQVACESMDRLRSTARSHDRIIIVEIMGRHAGWLTAYSGIAGGADVILVPEFSQNLDFICESLESVKNRGKNYALIAIAEGTKIIGDDGKEILSQSKAPVDAFGHVALGGIGDLLQTMLKERTGRDVRSVVLGHTQRGGSPTAMDRVLSTALGVEAVKCIVEKDYGKMAALKEGRISRVSLQEGVGRLKTLSQEFYDFSQLFRG
ncbi:MAG: ATP-dependent 6-phosphofructokinase [Bdellovibrionales bacterium]|nr:ATP-dependent 6-phosphofructokinase [Bdellovibrionales bacterium]